MTPGVYYAMPIITYLALLTTFSRGAYLMFLVSFLTLSILNKSLKLLVATIILTTLLLLSFYIYQQTVAAPRNIDRTQSATFRINTWQQGWNMFQKAPWLGVGYNAYRFALIEYNLAPTDFTISHGGTSNDSSLLFVLSTTGLIGLISYLIFLGLLYWRGYTNHLQQNPAGTIIVSGLTGLLTASFFSNNLFYPFILIWLVLLIAKLEK